MKRAIFLLSLFVLISCTQEKESSSKSLPLAISLGRDIQATVSVRGYGGEWINDPAIARLFDGDQNTWWTAPRADCKNTYTVFLHLSRPVFVRGARIISHGSVLPREAGAILNYPGDNERIESIFFRAKLKGEKNQTLDVSQNYYSRLLKAGSLALDFDGCYPADGKLEIAEIIFDFSDQSNFRPEIPAQELKSKVKSLAEYASDGFWKFSGEQFEHYPEADESKEKKMYLSKLKEREIYLSHLIYYGLQGDKKAEKLFLEYHPPGAASGEEASYIKRWYGVESAGRGKAR